MTRNEAKLRVQASLASIIIEELMSLLLENKNKICYDFEQDLAIQQHIKLMLTIKINQVLDKNIERLCETCSRFYADNYEDKK